MIARRKGKLRSFIISVWEFRHVNVSRFGKRYLKRMVRRGLRRERKADEQT